MSCAKTIRCLRQGHDGRRKRSQGEDRRGRLPDMVSIHERPPEVEGRLVPRTLGGGSDQGRRQPLCRFATLVERTSRLVMLAKMPDASAASALEALTPCSTAFRSRRAANPDADQGREMSRHKELTERTGVRVYFADPHSPGSAAAMKTPMA